MVKKCIDACSLQYVDILSPGVNPIAVNKYIIIISDNMLHVFYG